VRAECVRSASECVRVRQRLRVRYRLSECVRVRYRASECVRVRYRASECGTVRYRAVLCNILILSFNWLVEGSKVPLPPFPEVCSGSFLWCVRLDDFARTYDGSQATRQW
jgi:hypothetical protein